MTKPEPLPLFPARGKPRPAREPKPALPRESATQKAVVELLEWALAPGWRFTANAAGAWLSFDKDTAERIGRWLREQGVKPGWPDVQLVCPAGRFHSLELKRGAKGRLSEAQLEFERHCKAMGWPHAVARSFDEARAILSSWGAIRKAVEWRR